MKLPFMLGLRAIGTPLLKFLDPPLEYARVVEELDVTQKKLKRSEDIRIKIEKENQSRGQQLRELTAMQACQAVESKKMHVLINHLKTLLASTQESLATAESEKMKINEKKAVLERKLEKKNAKLEKLLSKLEKTRKMKLELFCVKNLHEQFVRKVREDTVLWETLKKGLQQLIPEKDRDYAWFDIDFDIDNEIQNILNILGKVRKEFESLHEQIDKLQKENDDLSSQLTSSRRQLREMEEKDEEKDFSDCFRLELEHLRSRLSVEIKKIRKQRDSCKRQIKKEKRMRLAAEQEATAAKQDVSLLKNKMSFKDKAIEDQEKKFSETEEAYHRLQKEMDELKEHVEKCTVPLSDLETYKETVDQKNHEEMSQKLSELNTFMEQQAARQHEIDNMKAMHAIEESTRKDKELSTLKAQLDQAVTELEKAKHNHELIASQSSQFKELYEKEQRKKEKLADEFEKARDKIIEECNKSRKLIPGWMLNPSTRHRSLSLGASTSFRQSEQTADEVVQSKLHKDSVDKNEGREEHPMAESHLDSSVGSTRFSCHTTAESGNTTAENQ